MNYNEMSMLSLDILFSPAISRELHDLMIERSRLASILAEIENKINLIEA